MFNDKIKGLLVGLLAGSMLTGGLVFARSGNQWIEASYDNIKLYVNGSKVDTSSNEPFIYNGSTYLPVRAVAEALGQNVDWDGNTKSVYIGSTIKARELTEKDSIGYSWVNGDNLKDNYGNTYSRSIVGYANNAEYEVLCNRKYKRLTGTIYVSNGYSGDLTTQILIKKDNQTVYISPEINKTSYPVTFDIDISDCNDLKIITTNDMVDLWAGSIVNIGFNIGNLAMYP